WRGGPATRNWLVFTHCDDGKGHGLALDAHAPSVPTHYWSGSYSYSVKMRISPALAPGLYKIKVGLYAGGERLRLQPGPGVIEDEQQRYQTGLLTILPDTTPPKLLDLPLKAGQKITGQFSLHF